MHSPSNISSSIISLVILHRSRHYETNCSTPFWKENILCFVICHISRNSFAYYIHAKYLPSQKLYPLYSSFSQRTEFQFTKCLQTAKIQLFICCKCFDGFYSFTENPTRRVHLNVINITTAPLRPTRYVRYVSFISPNEISLNYTVMCKCYKITNDL